MINCFLMAGVACHALRVQQLSKKSIFFVWLWQGFRYVASGPMVRSSYKAGEFYIKSMIESDRAASNSQPTQLWLLLPFLLVICPQQSLQNLTMLHVSWHISKLDFWFDGFVQSFCQILVLLIRCRCIVTVAINFCSTPI